MRTSHHINAFGVGREDGLAEKVQLRYQQVFDHLSLVLSENARELPWMDLQTLIFLNKLISMSFLCNA